MKSEIRTWIIACFIVCIILLSSFYVVQSLFTSSIAGLFLFGGIIFGVFGVVGIIIALYDMTKNNRNKA